MNTATAAVATSYTYFKKRSDNEIGVRPDILADLGLAQERRTRRRPDASLNCRYCRYRITHPAERIDILQRHIHTFVNPYGLTYRIGCFAAAPGVRMQGEATEQWTWFPGYRWQIAVCGSCGAHLGWHYSAGDDFFGLIIDRLVEQESPASPR